MSRWYRTARVLLLGMLLLLEGCMFSTLRDELTEMRTRPRPDRQGFQTDPAGNERAAGPVSADPRRPQDFAGHHPELRGGPVRGRGPDTGTFYLFAFEDLDNDLTWDGKEPSGYYGGPDPIVVTDRSPETLKELDIHLDASAARPGGFPEAVSLSAEKLGDSVVKIGQVVGFDDPILSRSTGTRGTGSR